MPHHTGSLITDYDNFLDKTGGKDQELCNRARYGVNVDRWYKAVDAGDKKKAKEYWRAVLTELKSCRRIWILLLDLRMRWCLGESDAKVDRHGDEFHRNLIADTEAAVGRDHRFSADVLSFCANYFETCGNEAEATACYRRALEIRLKTFEKDDPATLNAYLLLAENLYKMKRFAESEQFFKEYIAGCRHNKDSDGVADGVRRYADLMRKSGKIKEAYVFEAKYGTRLKSND